MSEAPKLDKQELWAGLCPRCSGTGREPVVDAKGELVERITDVIDNHLISDFHPQSIFHKSVVREAVELAMPLLRAVSTGEAKTKAGITATLDRYSAALGWGLGGHQEECMTLLDMAVDELAEKRAIVPEVLAALKVARGHVLAVCEHNKKVNGARRSEEDRRDLEQINAAIAKSEDRP